MIVTLPNGLLDGGDLFNKACIDELRGKQQNYLANRDLVVGNIGHIPKILEDMLISLETENGLKWEGDLKKVIWKLPSGDIETLLVKIRENTFGERFYFEAECSHCGHNHKNQRLDLDKLELNRMSLEEITDSKSRTLKLPKSGKEVELKPIYLKDYFDIIKITTDSQDKLITPTVALSIKRIDKETKVTSEMIDDLPLKDIHYIGEKMEDMKLEGTIDIDVYIKCKKCKKEFVIRLDVYNADFFSHSRGSKSSTT